jgi:hypothetical protein
MLSRFWIKTFRYVWTRAQDVYPTLWLNCRFLLLSTLEKSLSERTNHWLVTLFEGTPNSRTVVRSHSIPTTHTQIGESLKIHARISSTEQLQENRKIYTLHDDRLALNYWSLHSTLAEISVMLQMIQYTLGGTAFWIVCFFRAADHQWRCTTALSGPYYARLCRFYTNWLH